MLGKFLFGSFVVIGGTAVLVPPFGKKLDRNVLTPIRDYNEHLKAWNDFKTEVYLYIINYFVDQEEFVNFVKQLSSGVVKMFKFEE